MMSTHIQKQVESHMPREYQASACGKAIIVGEHSVVYGTRAVAMPLPSMRFTFRLRSLPNLGNEPEIEFKLDGQDLSPRVQAVISQAMKLLDIPSFSMQGQSESGLPIGAGLGSSATLCVAVLRALAATHGRSLSAHELAFMANELEKSFHGTPSGLDAAVVAFEQCIVFRKGGPIQAIARPREKHSSWRFLLVDSGLRASTLAMIQLAEPFFKGPDGDKHLAAFDEISLCVHSALESSQQGMAGEAMQRCDQLLRAAGVVPAAMQAQIDAIRELGVLGVKSTGAGGGGMILALLDPQSARNQAAAIRKLFGTSACYEVEL